MGFLARYVSPCRIKFICQKTSHRFELFFVRKYLVVGASSMLWTGQWVSEWVRDACISHQSNWIYYKQPIQFLVLVGDTCNTGLLVGCGKKSNFAGFSWTNSWKKTGWFCGNLAGIFEASFAEKRLVENGRFSWKLPGQISLESDWFCTDFRNVFNETTCRRSYSIYLGFIPQYEIILYKLAYWTYM